VARDEGERRRRGGVVSLMRFVWPKMLMAQQLTDFAGPICGLYFSILLLEFQIARAGFFSQSKIKIKRIARLLKDVLPFFFPLTNLQLVTHDKKKG
jgi:hypothetical protein